MTTQMRAKKEKERNRMLEQAEANDTWAALLTGSKQTKVIKAAKQMREYAIKLDREINGKLDSTIATMSDEDLLEALAKPC